MLLAVDAEAGQDVALVRPCRVFGEIFEPYVNDYYRNYWLGHRHISPGESKWRGDEVKICENILVDERGEQQKEPDYPDWPTLLYVTGSEQLIENALRMCGFEPLQVKVM